MITAFLLVAICIHALQFVFLLDAFVYELRTQRSASRWQVLAMLVDLAVVVWAVFILVTHV